MGMDDGLLERELCGGADEWKCVEVGGLQPAGDARRFLERRSAGPPLSEPRQVHLRNLGQRPRVPSCSDAHAVSLYILASCGGPGGASPLVESSPDGFSGACVPRTKSGFLA